MAYLKLLSFQRICIRWNSLIFRLIPPCMNTSAEIPSIPGAFPDSIPFMACSSSFIEGGTPKSSLTGSYWIL